MTRSIKPGVLVREAVVILPPDVGGQQVVQRGDGPPPRRFPTHLQPLGMLGEHGIDDADERLVAVEQPVAPGEKISLQPALASMLAQHLHHASLGREELIDLDRLGIPLPIGHFKDSFQTIGDGLVGGDSKDTIPKQG